MRVLGILLVIGGIVALIYGGFSFTKREKVLDVGPIEASVDKKERVAISPLIGGLAIAAGLVMVFAGARRNPA